MNTPRKIAVQQVEISTGNSGQESHPRQHRTDHDPSWVSLVAANGTWRADIHLRRSTDRPLLAEGIARGLSLCVVGDADEVRAEPTAPSYANATVFALDAGNSVIGISTSLTGLPPVFVLRRGSRVNLSCPFLPEAARGALEPDMEGVADTLRWGHPLDGRTLFANLQFVASNSKVSVSSDGAVSIGPPEVWPCAPELASLSREEIVREEVRAFSEAARRIPTDNAFMSLSGGLDSRTSLVALLSHGHRVPCVTMGGSPQNLDVRLARAFCAAHGLTHHMVLLDAEFHRRVPELLVRSAELTGGVSCLSQTADLFLYESMGTNFTTRISGNLGNQVGRGGVESLSACRPDTQIFSAEVRHHLSARPVAPWFIPRLARADYGETLFGQEVHFWSIANYVAGSSRAMQLTPYADRRLMQLARAAFARDRELAQPTWKTLRARDLRHRFTGTPRELSFQRQFLAQQDSQASDIPLNWGWRAAGGRSAGWSLSAVASAADAGLGKVGRKSALMRPVTRWLSSKLGHRSALVDWPNLVVTRLRELAMDTFSSQQVRHAGIFNLDALDRVLNEHFRGSADHQHTVLPSLEIALGLNRRA